MDRVRDRPGGKVQEALYSLGGAPGLGHGNKQAGYSREARGAETFTTREQIALKPDQLVVPALTGPLRVALVAHGREPASTPRRLKLTFAGAAHVHAHRRNIPG